ncbi:MAG: hypothetical protein IPM45_16920 [Acidimicrobiales bacterium]|nr:hypothetical protein [Acidimicrobiales bacterium]
MTGPTEGAGSPAPPARAWVGPAVVAVLARPRLWGTAVVELARLAPRGWWRRTPHLPLPDPAYLAFRMQTAYGSTGRPPRPADVVTWLGWCRQLRDLD